MSNKLSITQDIIERCAEPLRLTVEQALHEWWQNPRPDSGLRFSAQGFAMANLAGLEHFKFELPRQDIHRRGSTLLILDRKMTCPYYITAGRQPQIWIYGSREAAVFALYGDIAKFLRGLTY